MKDCRHKGKGERTLYLESKVYYWKGLKTFKNWFNKMGAVFR